MKMIKNVKFKEKNINDNKYIDMIDFDSSIISRTEKIYYDIKYFVFYKILRKKHSKNKEDLG